MNRFTKFFFGLLGLTTIVALAFPAVARRETKDLSKKVFVMEVSVTGRPTFILPVRVDEKKLAVLPMNGTTASGVKIVPRATGESLQFDLLAVVEKLPETLSCDNMKKLKAEQVTSYSTRDGQVIRVSDFEKFGVASFIIRVRLVPDEGIVCPDGACCCGVNTCYPNPGHCIECGSCGTCCRTGS
jgi:hypothetical protein